MYRCTAPVVLALVAGCGRIDFDPNTDALGGCDDHDPCTNPDVWVNGVCTGGPVSGGPATCLSPRQIDRSVGVGAPAPIASSNGTLTIRGTSAIFSVPQPD